MSDNPYQPPQTEGASSRPLWLRPHGTRARRRRFAFGVAMIGGSLAAMVAVIWLINALGLSNQFNALIDRVLRLFALFAPEIASRPGREAVTAPTLVLSGLVALSLPALFLSALVADSAYPYRLRKLRRRRAWQRALMPPFLRRERLADRR